MYMSPPVYVSLGSDFLSSLLPFILRAQAFGLSGFRPYRRFAAFAQHNCFGAVTHSINDP